MDHYYTIFLALLPLSEIQQLQDYTVKLFHILLKVYSDTIFWSKNSEQSLPLLLLFPWPQVPGSGSSTWLDPPCLQILCRRKKKNLGSKSNNSRCSISVSLRYASFQVLLSPCEIDSQCVENLRPCWHCCTDTCCGLRCPWTPEVLPPPLLLTEPISTPCSFVSSLFALQNTYLTHSVQAWLCGFHNEMPGKFLHVFGELFLLLLGTFWQVCAARVRPTKVLSSVTYFCCCSFLYILCSTNCEELHREIIRVGCFLSCPRCSPKLFFLSAATALKTNSAQKKNCSLTAVVSLKVFIVS